MKAILITAIVFLSAFGSFAEEKEKYYAPTLTANFTLYSLDPERVGGWCLRLRDYEKRYMDQKYTQLPVLGGWFRGGAPDWELLMKLRLKKAFVVSAGDARTDLIGGLQKFGMAVSHYQATELEDYIPILRNLGKELGVPERGEALAKYGEEAIARTKAMVADIPENQKVRVLWGIGNDVQSTTCNSAILELVGAVSVHECSDSDARLNFEQIILYDPDAVVIVNPSGRKVLDDPKWKRLRAFRNGKVYVVPFGPFSWLHLPEITRFLGIQWLACVLYPNKCSVDINAEAKKFTKLFMHADITDKDLDEIMYRNGK